MILLLLYNHIWIFEIFFPDFYFVDTEQIIFVLVFAEKRVRTQQITAKNRKRGNLFFLEYSVAVG